MNKMYRCFEGVVGKLDFFQSTDKHEALEKITKSNPDVVFIKFHFTKDELYEGLWVAKELKARKFKGTIIFSSSLNAAEYKVISGLTNCDLDKDNKRSIQIAGDYISDIYHYLT